jgi:transcriptional regulator with XRE-family HTH domain
LTIGKYIRAKRVAANMSLRELAAAADLTDVGLGQIERDRVVPGRSKLITIMSKIPGASIDNFWEGREIYEN